MSAITTYIVDTTSGRPGAGIPATLELRSHSVGWEPIAEGITDPDGRINDFLSRNEAFLPGHYRLIFETGSYFLMQNIEYFFPQITVSFVVKDPMEHYHVSVLLSPFGYSTYRGS